MDEKLVTWDELVALEPGLNDLLEEARAAESQGVVNGMKLFEGPNGLKMRMSQLVGTKGRHPRTSTPSAYDVAYNHILNALPVDPDE